MKSVRFLLNAMRFKRYEVYELPDEEADEYLHSGIAIEVEPEGQEHIPVSTPKRSTRKKTVKVQEPEIEPPTIEIVEKED